MKHALYILAALTFAACTKDIGQKIAASDSDRAVIVHSAADAVSGEMIVRFRPEAEGMLNRTASDSIVTRSGIDGLDRILEDIGVTAIEPVFNITERNREAVYKAGLHNEGDEYHRSDIFILPQFKGGHHLSHTR